MQEPLESCLDAIGNSCDPPVNADDLAPQHLISHYGVPSLLIQTTENLLVPPRDADYTDFVIQEYQPARQ